MTLQMTFKAARHAHPNSLFCRHREKKKKSEICQIILKTSQVETSEINLNSYADGNKRREDSLRCSEIHI